MLVPALCQYRRFREFQSVWKALKRLPKESRDHIPPLPPTTWSLSHTKDDEVTRERHAALAKCVRDALDYVEPLPCLRCEPSSSWIRRNAKRRPSTHDNIRWWWCNFRLLVGEQLEARQL